MCITPTQIHSFLKPNLSQVMTCMSRCINKDFSNNYEDTWLRSQITVPKLPKNTYELKSKRSIVSVSLPDVHLHLVTVYSHKAAVLKICKSTGNSYCCCLSYLIQCFNRSPLDLRVDYHVWLAFHNPTCWLGWIPTITLSHLARDPA